jgi:IS605 OrfB family transposase
MPNELYRTYEVLVEESVHPDNPKRQRTKKKSRPNAATARALQTTNDVFQDAVCYYLFLIIGLLRDVPETERDEINPLWRTLNDPLKSKVEDVLKHLNDKYPVAVWHSTDGALDLMSFLSKTYCAGLNLTKETMQATYDALKIEASKKKKNKATGNYDVVEGELDLGMFPQTWMGLLTNESKRLMKTIGGADWRAPYFPKETSGNRPLFPAFSNCLGIELTKGSKTVWRELDKNALSKAAEEVFKYKIRSDKRRDEYNAKKGKVAAMEGDGNWTYEVERSGQKKQETKQLRGIRNDIRAERVKIILEEIGGGIGYGLSRSTISGWRDLREAFLQAETKKGEELSSDDLEALLNKAQSESAGGFGSAALFKKLCEPENWCVWQNKWESKQDFHPKNFLLWYARYGEAKAELDALEEKDGTNNLKPISITLPGTANRHGETSFRPFSFELTKIEVSPKIDLLDCENGVFKKIITNETEGYPLTLSYRRLKRDRIVKADGTSVESFYQIPLILDDELTPVPNLHESKKNKEKAAEANDRKDAQTKASKEQSLKVSVSLLPPEDENGSFHFSMAFPVPIETLLEKMPKIPGEKSFKSDKPINDYFPGAYFRWPSDVDTEKFKKAEKKNIWCAKETNFAPFHILSVDLGVRFAGAWCRAEIVRRDPQENERVISSPLEDGDTGKIVFSVKAKGTFRVQGEDAKIWQKHKGEAQHTFAQEPWGSAGRKADADEIKNFKELAESILPTSVRSPLPEDSELKYFPRLGEHLQFRLKRRIGHLRFLFNLRWRAIGKMEKETHSYQERRGDELVRFQNENRFRALEMLYFRPHDDVKYDQEESYMAELRGALVGGDLSKWDAIVPKELFEKKRKKKELEEQKKKQAEFRNTLNTKTDLKWDALAAKANEQIKFILQSVAGADGWVAQVAHYIWPQRSKAWRWNPCARNKDGKQSHIDYNANSERREKIDGMRGLNMRRIELFQEFRRCLQSLAKQERRCYRDDNDGLEPSVIERGDTVHDPAPAWQRRINEFREQRVKQTAHLILAEALGLRLKNPDDVKIDGKTKPELKSERDLHGRYERAPDRPIVSAIVLENLSRYRMSLDRSRFENRQLMEWSHRAVLLKLQDMAKVFGIQIFTVDARFSSRFCSRSGVPGIRCAEVAKGFEKEYPWKKWAEETVKNKDGNREPSERAKFIADTATLLNASGVSEKATAILPMDGGPSFISVTGQFESNADINAAVNIGLRAVAHPDCLDVFPVFLVIVKNDGTLELKQPKRGIYALANSERKLSPAKAKSDKTTTAESVSESNASNEDEDESESENRSYLFALSPRDGQNAFSIPDEERYPFPHHKGSVAATTKIFWSRVKAETLKQIREINRAKLEKCAATTF